jgi:hypothetical protein
MCNGRWAGLLVSAFLLTLGSGALAQPTEAVAMPRWRGTLGIGTTAVAANNVLPLPAALGASLLVEHDRLGVEAAVHFDAATLCDHGTASDSNCGCSGSSTSLRV